VCPSCGAAPGADERFCPDCGLPLVRSPAPEEPLSDVRERARKVRPQYSEGPLVRVAFARHQAEAELIQGLLLEEGVPSIVKRSMGFDVPDFLASGPRDIFVPASGADVARDVLAATPAGAAPSAVSGPRIRAGRPAARPWVQAMAVALAVVLLALSAAGIIAVLL
jgi:hypothetical protein